MAITIGDIEVQLSGGAANTDPDASLGGAISTAASKANMVVSQTASAPTNVTGVDIINAYGNPEGDGTLTWVDSTGFLRWQPPTIGTYVEIEITADTIVAIGNTNGYIVCDVTFASLPGTTQSDTDITIANAVENTFDNVSATESLAGDIEYRCFYIRNEHATDTAFDVRIWVKSQPTGPDELDICLDPNGLNGTAETAIDEADSTNQISGETFSRPSTQATGLTLGNLTADDYRAFWIRRTVAAASTQAEPNDISAIGISALV